MNFSDLPPGKNLLDYQNSDDNIYGTVDSNATPIDENDLRPHVKSFFEKDNGGFDQPCTAIDCSFCQQRKAEVNQFKFAYCKKSCVLTKDNKCYNEYQQKKEMAGYYSYFDHPMFVQPTFQMFTQLITYLNGSCVMTTQNSPIAVYHMADAKRMHPRNFK